MIIYIWMIITDNYTYMTYLYTL